MKNLLGVTAVMEAGAGMALLGLPSAMVKLLLGLPIDGPPSAILVRVVGVLLLALGVACWLASRHTLNPCATRMVMGMTAYNPTAIALLVAIGIRAPSVGVLLWPAVVLHAAMAAWCIVFLMKKPSNI